MEEKRNFVFPIHRFLSWPLIAILVLASFALVFMTVLPWLNMVGYTAFWNAGTGQVSFNYFLIPFTALDVCVLLGYFKAVRKLAPMLDRGVASLCGGIGRRAAARKAAWKAGKARKKAAKAA